MKYSQYKPTKVVICPFCWQDISDKPDDGSAGETIGDEEDMLYTYLFDSFAPHECDIFKAFLRENLPKVTAGYEE